MNKEHLSRTARAAAIIVGIASPFAGHLVENSQASADNSQPPATHEPLPSPTPTGIIGEPWILTPTPERTATPKQPTITVKIEERIDTNGNRKFDSEDKGVMQDVEYGIDENKNRIIDGNEGIRAFHTDEKGVLIDTFTSFGLGEGTQVCASVFNVPAELAPIIGDACDTVDASGLAVIELLNAQVEKTPTPIPTPTSVIGEPWSMTPFPTKPTETPSYIADITTPKALPKAGGTQDKNDKTGLVEAITILGLALTLPGIGLLRRAAKKSK